MQMLRSNDGDILSASGRIVVTERLIVNGKSNCLTSLRLENITFEQDAKFIRFEGGSIYFKNCQALNKLRFDQCCGDCIDLLGGKVGRLEFINCQFNEANYAGR